MSVPSHVFQLLFDRLSDFSSGKHMDVLKLDAKLLDSKLDCSYHVVLDFWKVIHGLRCQILEGFKEENLLFFLPRFLELLGCSPFWGPVLVLCELFRFLFSKMFHKQLLVSLSYAWEFCNGEYYKVHLVGLKSLL